MSKITFLIFGDIVGKIGRQALIKNLPDLKKRYKPDLIIANAENLAHGRGITPKSIQEMADAGINVFTSGQHVWDNQTGVRLLDDHAWSKRLIRPINVPPTRQGKGWTTINIKNLNVTLLNLQGRLFMPPESSSPFFSFERFWKEHQKDDPNTLLIIDFHAEATSEKLAFGNFVDGRASVIFGTHTHVPTADLKVLPQGTAYISDVGMVGALDSVIGFEKNSSIERFLNLTEAPYKLEEHGQAEINGVILSLDFKTKKYSKLHQIRKIVDI